MNLPQSIRIARQLGITTLNQLLILEAIADGNEHRPTDIATRTGLAPGHFTEIANTLRGKGLIHRTRAAHDQRIIYLTLSPQGANAILALGLTAFSPCPA